MLYLLYGNETDKARAKAQALVDMLLKKKPDASFFKLNDESFTESSFEEYIGGQGLFENKYIVLADGLLGNKMVKEFVSKRLKDLKESQNVFILREGELDKATLTKLEKNAEKVQEFSVEKEKKREEFNVFSLTDALGKRDKKGLWVLFRQAKEAYVEDEQIHGILFWQLKSMLLASLSRTAGEAGLNPFVFSKSQGFVRNYKSGELKRLSCELIDLYHFSRRGKHELDTALERWILKL